MENILYTMDNADTRQKVVKYMTIAWIIVVVLVVIYVVIMNIVRSGKSEIMIKCAPYTAEVYVDGSKVNNNAEKFLTDGEHDVRCFLAGFEIYDEKVKTSPNEKSILIELLSITSEGEKIKEERLNDYYDLESYAGKALNEQKADSKTQEELNKIRFNNEHFGIGTVEENGETLITITAFEPNYAQMAVNKLIDMAKEANVSLASHGFRINDFVNITENFQENESDDLGEYVKNGFYGMDYEICGEGDIGEYHYVFINIVQPKNGPVVYRSLFKKENDSWKLVATPYPVLNTKNTPGVSEEILDNINNTEIEISGNE